MKKICTKCKEEKSLDEFHNSSKEKSGKKSQCKSCVKEINSKRYIDKKEHITKVNKEYSKNNRDKKNEIARLYYSKNKEESNNKSRRWQAKNKEHIRKWCRERTAYRKTNDPIFKLLSKYKSDLHKHLKRKTKSSLEYLGCNGEDYFNYLNNNKYGFIYGDKNLDIDHIIPLSSVKTEEELIPLLHYTNTQLLPSYYNRHIKKENLYDEKHFEEWMKNLK